ncbi:DUF2381 family protein [Pyxidicoccus parkwayensis]|uniref:DUF2381 family protein n=1 Tax=Pyxidicoccus parkwayensis TaxID=2813578 RepID=A0ABX7NUG2_9BACT|nr:DUF2381 family protein [Pyxidicoccus parkwaysis]QSQ22056.1 DUF2381 family protein [Pyxidicoccus parkwaysis]
MSASLRVPLLVLVALGAMAAAAQESPGSREQAREPTRRIELSSESPAALPEIAIQPGIASLMLFDGPLIRDRLDLEGRERFRRVVVGEDTVALVPSEALRDGERLRLTVRFAAGRRPTEALFLLVVVQEHADTQVEVVRERNAGPPDLKDPGELMQELQRLREENARLRAERGPSELVGAIASQWMGDTGVAVKQLKWPATQVRGVEFAQMEAMSFRVEDKIAVEVSMTFPPGEHPWRIGSAALIGPQGQRPHILQVWQSGSTAGSNPDVRIIVEADAPRNKAPGAYTLELQEAGGTRTLTVEPVRFPNL